MPSDPAKDDPEPDLATTQLQPTLNVQLSETVLRGPAAGAAEKPDAHQATPSPLPAIPGYELLEELGRGGMGVVYKARHVKLNRVVALKMILSGDFASEREVKRFRAEAETIAHIQHPNIIQIFDIGEHEGKTFLSLEYCDGGSLEALLHGTPLPATDAARLVLVIARAIEHAHQCGVIHRDLKPANILLQKRSHRTARGTAADASKPEESAGSLASSSALSLGPGSIIVPKITDFGIAKKVNEAGQTQTGAIIGSPSHMSPEQASGKEVGPLSDVYALGGMLYECLTGRPPFRAATVYETLWQVQNEEPVPPRQLQRTIPRDVETICLKCLQKDSSRRYGSAAELREDLRHFLDGKAIRARPAGWAERTWRWCRRNPAVAGLLVLVAVLFLSGAVAGSVALVVLDQARRMADANAALEAEARTMAERSADQSRQRLVRLHVATGTRFLDANDRDAALCWYLHAWRSDRPDPANERDHRLRLASVMSLGPQLTAVCFHRKPVQDAAVSPDGSRLLSYTTEGREAYVWDPTASRLAVPPLSHDGPIRHACFSPDGRFIATAADRAACVWDVNSGRRLRKLEHPSGVAWLAFRPRTTHLLTVDDDGQVHGWDAATGRPAGVAPRSAAGIWYVAFSEDGRRLVTADRANHARVWDAATGAAKTSPLPHLALSPDEAFFRYQRWPVFNPAGTLLATATKNAVQLWDTSTGAPRWPTEKRFDELLPPMHVAFNRPGSRLVVSNGYVARVLRVDDGKELLGFRHPRINQSAAFSNDDRHLVSMSSGGVVHVWDAATGRAVDRPLHSADFVRRVGFFPDNRRFFAAGLDGTVRVWSLPTADRLLTPYSFDCGRAHNRVVDTPQGSQTFSPDGALLARFGPAGIEVRRRAGAEEVLWRQAGAIRFARFTDDGRRLVAANRAEVQSLDARTGRQLGKSIPLDGGLGRRSFAIHTTRICLSADGRRLATLDDPRTVSVWDVETGRRVLGPLRDVIQLPHLFGPPESHGQISHPRLTPDGQTLIFGVPSSGLLAAWDVASGQALYQVKRYSGNLHDIAVSDDGRSILAVSSNTTARLYDARTGEPLGPSLVHTGGVFNGDIAADGVRVVTREALTARIWDARNGDLLGRLPNVPKDVEPVWFSRDGERVILSNNEHAFAWRLPRLEMPADQVPALVRLLTSRDIDDANGLTQLDQHAFLNDPTPYRKAWMIWRGGVDDAQAQP